MRNLLLMFLTVRFMSAQTPATNRRYYSTSARSEEIVAKMAEPALISEVRRFVEPSGVKLGHCVFFGSEADKLIATGRGGSECDYDVWRAMIDRRGLTREPVHCPEFAEGLKLGGDIGVRTVDTACHVKTSVLSGRDPFRVQIGKRQYEIVWVDMRPSNAPDIPNVDVLLMIRSAANEAAAKESLEHLRRLTGVDHMSVVLRSDPWFVRECDYAPPLFFFDSVSIRLPTKAEYRSGPQASCGNHTGSINCLTLRGLE